MSREEATRVVKRKRAAPKKVNQLSPEPGAGIVSEIDGSSTYVEQSIEDMQVDWERELKGVSEVGDSYSSSNHITLDVSVDEWAMQKYFYDIGMPMAPHPLTGELCWLYRKKDSFPTAKYADSELKRRHELVEHRELPTHYNQRMRSLYYLIFFDPEKYARCVQFTDCHGYHVEELCDHYEGKIKARVVWNKVVDNLRRYAPKQLDYIKEENTRERQIRVEQPELEYGQMPTTYKLNRPVEQALREAAEETEKRRKESESCRKRTSRGHFRRRF